MVIPCIDNHILLTRAFKWQQLVGQQRGPKSTFRQFSLHVLWYRNGWSNISGMNRRKYRKHFSQGGNQMIKSVQQSKSDSLKRNKKEELFGVIRICYIRFRSLNYIFSECIPDRLVWEIRSSYDDAFNSLKQN